MPKNINDLSKSINIKIDFSDENHFDESVQQKHCHYDCSDIKTNETQEYLTKDKIGTYKYTLDDVDVELLNQSEEGRIFLKYNKITKGQPLGLMVPSGYPVGVEELGGVIAVYLECIEKGITWEELLDYEEFDDDILY